MSDAWIKALRFAALPGAAKVRFEKQTRRAAGAVSVHYRLRSYSASGHAIGDDRDYDLLKAVMTPMEMLADAEDHKELKLELDLESGELTRVRVALKS